jgi:hypothetical protein
MIPRHWLAAVPALAALAVPAIAAAGPSIRCAGGLVSEGDARIDLLGKCGPPSFQDAHVDERWVASGRRHGGGALSAGRTVGVVVELWSYDLGPDAFVHVVTLENGRVVAIARLGYGYRRPAPTPPRPLVRARCDLAVVREGDVKLDVLSRCGEPVVVDAWDETGEVLLTDARGLAASGERSTVRVETWTYDLGRNRLVRFVRFENGRVVEVSSGSYGYAE